MGLKTPYLIAYNVSMFIGWTLFIFSFSSQYLLTKNINLTYEKSFQYLRIFQYGAVLEIIHIILKLVKSPLMTTIIQVMSRIIIVYILSKVKSSVSIGYILLSFAWGVTEMIRYTYYYLSLIQKNYNTKFVIPYPLIWSRYSFFIVLYPIGVSGELITLWKSTIELKNYSFLNINIADIIYFRFVLYVPGLFVLYTYMLRQRKSTFKKLKEKKE